MLWLMLDDTVRATGVTINGCVGSRPIISYSLNSMFACVGVSAPPAASIESSFPSAMDCEMKTSSKSPSAIDCETRIASKSTSANDCDVITSSKDEVVMPVAS